MKAIHWDKYIYIYCHGEHKYWCINEWRTGIVLNGFHSSLEKGKMFAVPIHVHNNFLLAYSLIVLPHTVKNVHEYLNPCDILAKSHSLEFYNFLCLKLDMFSFRKEYICITERISLFNPFRTSLWTASVWFLCPVLVGPQLSCNHA